MLKQYKHGSNDARKKFICNETLKHAFWYPDVNRDYNAHSPPTTRTAERTHLKSTTFATRNQDFESCWQLKKLNSLLGLSGDHQLSLTIWGTENLGCT